MFKHCCEDMDRNLRSTRVSISFFNKFREYGIKGTTEGDSHHVIRFCPWCGTRLPESLRDEWFDEMEKQGFELGDPDIPEAYKSEKWYLNRGA